MTNPINYMVTYMLDVPKPGESAMGKGAGNSCLPDEANWVTEP
jgi:hypothetical protein